MVRLAPSARTPSVVGNIIDGHRGSCGITTNLMAKSTSEPIKSNFSPLRLVQWLFEVLTSDVGPLDLLPFVRLFVTSFSRFSRC